MVKTHTQTRRRRSERSGSEEGGPNPDEGISVASAPNPGSKLCSLVDNERMQGHGKELQVATDKFANALPVGTELAAVAEQVLAAIQSEIDGTEAEIRKFSEPEHSDHGGELAVVFRRGALRALTADRSRWTTIVNTLRQVPDRPIDADGFAYIRKSNSLEQEDI